MEDSVRDLLTKLSNLRKELKNVRHAQRALVAEHKKDIERLSQAIQSRNSSTDLLHNHQIQPLDPKTPDDYNFKPVGYIKSTFKNKNGTPRQSGICSGTTAKLVIDSTFFNNPDHSLDGLDNFSHVWLLFIFHKNNKKFLKAKVQPPRLNGISQGVFATRSPYRPNPIGLTLAKIIKIEDNIIYLSGTDIINDTPVIDIKPYIGEYDSAAMLESSSSSLLASKIPSEDECLKELSINKSEINSEKSADEDIFRLQFSGQGAEDNSLLEKKAGANSCPAIREASWIKDANKRLKLNVRFTPTSENELLNMSRFNNCATKCSGSEDASGNLDCSFLNDTGIFKDAVCQILSADPRSSYRRKKCQDRLYFVTVDGIKLTCWFDADADAVEILKVCEDAEQMPS